MDYHKEIDYSSLSTYLSCPRKFLFQYVLHLRYNRVNIDLVFGSAWHYGLEQSYKLIQSAQKEEVKLNSSLLTTSSTNAFNTYWKLEGAPHFPNPDIIFPKSPGHAASMYKKYWDLYSTLDQETQIIGVEIPFSLPITSTTNYIGRIDLAAQHDNQIIITDHKTAKAIYPITQASFESSLQTDGYLTVGKIYFDKLPIMTYNIALCQKSKIAFHRMDILKRDQSTNRFLDDLKYHTTEIQNNLNIMSAELDHNKSCSTDKLYNPQAFRRSPGMSCTEYFSTCTYFDICMMRNNPYMWKDSPPQGYKVDEWHPAKHEERLETLLKETSNGN